MARRIRVRDLTDAHAIRVVCGVCGHRAEIQPVQTSHLVDRANDPILDLAYRCGRCRARTTARAVLLNGEPIEFAATVHQFDVPRPARQPARKGKRKNFFPVIAAMMLEREDAKAAAAAKGEQSPDPKED